MAEPMLEFTCVLVIQLTSLMCCVHHVDQHYAVCTPDLTLISTHFSSNDDNSKSTNDNVQSNKNTSVDNGQ